MDMPGSVRNFRQPSKPSSGNFETVQTEGYTDINLYISGLPPEITSNALGNLFESCGQVTRVKLLPKSNNFSTHAAFVCYATYEEAETARKQLNGFKFGEYAISIQYPHSRQPYNAGDSKTHYKDLLTKLEHGPLSDSDTSLLFNSSQEKRSHQESKRTNTHQQRTSRNAVSGGRGTGMKQPHGFKNVFLGCEEKSDGNQPFKSNSAGQGRGINQTQRLGNRSFGQGKNTKQQNCRRNFEESGDGIKQMQEFNNFGDFEGGIYQEKSFKSHCGGSGDGLLQSQRPGKKFGGRGNALRQNQGFGNGFDQHKDEMKGQYEIRKRTNNSNYQTSMYDKSGNDFASSRSTSRPPRGAFQSESRNESYQSKPFQKQMRDDPALDAATQQKDNFGHHPKNSAKLSHSPCRICGKMTQTFCSLCSFVHYCSEECQSKDWPEHSKICKNLSRSDEDIARENTMDQVEVGKKQGICSNAPQSSSKPSFVSQQKNSFPPAFISQHKRRTPSKSPRRPLSSSPKQKKQIARIPSNVKPGFEFDVLVTDIDAENAALICQVADEELLRSLSKQQDDLNSFFASNSAVTLTHPTVGEICAAQFSEDNMWYRAEIKTFDDDNAQVQFIDYGNSEIVSKTQLKQLVDTFCDTPAYCLTCKLAQTGNEKWTEEQLEFLGKVLQQTEMLLHAECLKTIDNVIYAYFSSEEIDINEKIIEFAAKPLKKYDKVIPESSNKTKLSPSKADNTPVHEKIQLPQECELAVELEDTTRIYELSDISSLKLPLDGFDVLISFIDNPNSFYCQIIGDDLMKLHELLQRLTEHCQADEKPNNIPLKKGNICCALFEEDQMWYRAQIVDVLSTDSFEVFYFDFGNSAKVLAEDIRFLPEDFMNLPIQAFKASMANCYPLEDGKWHNDAISSFKSFLNSSLNAKVIAKNSGMPQVLLFADDNQTINDKLVSEGFATKVLPETIADIHLDSGFENPTSHLKSYAPNLRKRLKISVTYINEGDVFYCHVIRPELEALFDSISELTLYANKAPQSLPNKPFKGTVCAAYFDEEQTWYRGIVESVEGNHFQVRYVDYGNTSQLSAKDIILLRDEFQRLPVQAVPCVLANIRPVSGTEWNKDYIDTMSGYVGKELDAEFLRKDGSNFVVLVPDLVNELIRNNIGQFCF